MNFWTFKIPIKINPRLNWGGAGRGDFHLHIFATRLILFLLKMNKKGFKLGLQVGETTLEVRE
jgi:hypothetical protein